MALQGTLKDFGIADIFQLIGVQQKTGVLKLTDKEKAVNVSFIKGKIVGAESTVRERKEHLGEMLVRAKIVSKHDLSKALSKQHETLQKLGDILVNFDMISKDDLSEMIMLQITETIYRLFNWKSGDYEFVQQNIEYEKEHIIPIAAEGILMDGFRMIDEWPKVKKTVKSHDMIFQKVFGAENKVLYADDDEGDDFEAAFAVFDGEKPKQKTKPGQVKLSRNERRIFSFVDGKRTVSEMINISRLGEFETCKAISILKEAGIIEVLATEKGGVKEVRSYETLGTIVNIFFLLLFVFIFYFIATTNDLTDITNLSANYFFEVKEYDVLKELQSERRIDKIENALYLYYLRNKSYPGELESLVRENLIEDEHIIDPWGVKYIYKVVDDSFSIRKFEKKIPVSSE